MYVGKKVSKLTFGHPEPISWSSLQTNTTARLTGHLELDSTQIYTKGLVPYPSTSLVKADVKVPPAVKISIGAKVMEEW